MKAKIPIRNIYYMLCYAWGILGLNAERHCGSEMFDEIYNLMARILEDSVSRLLKRGFYREYVTSEEALSMPRGKFEMKPTVQQLTMLKRQLVCSYDEMSPDVVFNQIIKAALKTLIRCPELDKDLKAKLEKLLRFFDSFKDIYPDNKDFAALQFSRNNQNYRLIINVCRLIFDGLVSNEESPERIFADFIRDRQMATLYEKFILNYYKMHLPRDVYDVGSPKIQWDLDIETPGTKYLPEMRTDIVIMNKTTNTQLIIDTKYYPEALTKKYWGEGYVLRSSHIFQIHAYVSNSKHTGRKAGMLLYPTVHDEIEETYHIKSGHITTKTLNLGVPWQEIENALHDIVRTIFA